MTKQISLTEQTTTAKSLQHENNTLPTQYKIWKSTWITESILQAKERKQIKIIQAPSNKELLFFFHYSLLS